MWRAFFYAVGYMSIFVGLQSLAFERVQLAPGKDARHILRKLLSEDSGGPVGANTVSTQRSATVSTSSKTASVPASSFGPSRFTNGGFGGGSFSAVPYRGSTGRGALGINSGRSSGVPRVDLAGYQSNSQQVQRVQTSQVNSTAKSAGRVIYSKEWMPWSLLAIGAVVVLYTRSFASSS